MRASRSFIAVGLCVATASSLVVGGSNGSFGSTDSGRQASPRQNSPFGPGGCLLGQVGHCTSGPTSPTFAAAGGMRTAPLGHASNASGCVSAADARCEKWVATYDDRHSHHSRLTDLQGFEWSFDVTPNPTSDTVYVTGSSWSKSTHSFDIATIAYSSSTGDQLWASRYDDARSLDDAGYALTLSPNGKRLFVTGVQSNCFLIRRLCNPNVVTIKYDATTGARSWTNGYDSPRSGAADAAYSIVTSPDGKRVFVSGETGQRCGTDAAAVLCQDYTTFAYDAATGQQLWIARASPEGGDTGSGLANVVRVSPDGARVYVGGVSLHGEYVTVAYDASTGIQMWIAREGSGLSTSSWGDLQVGADGQRVYITGTNQPPGGKSSAVVVAYDSTTGSELWSRTYSGGYGRFSSGGKLLVSNPVEGELVSVTATTVDNRHAPPSKVSATTITYDGTSGKRAWVSSYTPATGPADAEAYGIAGSPDGSRAYVSAIAANGNPAYGYDFATVAYDTASGQQVWVARYNSSASGLDSDVAAAIAVNPDGSSLFVTGIFRHFDAQGQPSPNPSDYGTVTYSTVDGGLQVAR